MKGTLDSDRGFLNKWEMYKALSDEDLGGCLLPYTVPWTAENLTSLAGQFHSLYIKPVDAWGGHGVSRIDLAPAHCTWHRTGAPKRRFTTLPALAAAVADVYQPSFSILQQAAPLALYHGRVFDLRALMQRDQHGSWLLAGVLARVGGADSVVSNIAVSSGNVLPVAAVLDTLWPPHRTSAARGRMTLASPVRIGRTRQPRAARAPRQSQAVREARQSQAVREARQVEALREARQVEALAVQADRRVDQVQRSIHAASLAICRVLEPYRPFWEIGIDFGVDSPGRLWLIEVNTDDALGGPSHDLFRQLPSPHVHRAIEQRSQRRRMEVFRWLFAGVDG